MFKRGSKHNIIDMNFHMLTTWQDLMQLDVALLQQLLDTVMPKIFSQIKHLSDLKGLCHAILAFF